MLLCCNSQKVFARFGLNSFITVCFCFAKLPGRAAVFAHVYEWLDSQNITGRSSTSVLMQQLSIARKITHSYMFKMQKMYLEFQK